MLRNSGVRGSDHFDLNVIVTRSQTICDQLVEGASSYFGGSFVTYGSPLDRSSAFHASSDPLRGVERSCGGGGPCLISANGQKHLGCGPDSEVKDTNLSQAYNGRILLECGED